LARASDSSFAVKNRQKVRNQVGFSPRYAAPEVFSQIQNRTTQVHFIYFLLCLKKNHDFVSSLG